jgi:hypothetical protein
MHDEYEGLYIRGPVLWLGCTELVVFVCNITCVCVVWCIFVFSWHSSGSLQTSRSVIVQYA